ncbi:hypothetical protein ACR9E3_30410 [Actinomycetospora sp. C-140]
MTIIIVVVVVWTLLTLGVLIGMSMHREATRQRVRRLHRERIELERDRAEFEADLRLLGRR